MQITSVLLIGTSCRSSYIAGDASAKSRSTALRPKCACLARRGGSNRCINSGFRRILCRGATTVVARYSLRWRGSGRVDDPYGGSWVDPPTLRINSIQPHAPAHALPQGKFRRCHSKHSAKGSCQVRRVGKSRRSCVGANRTVADHRGTRARRGVTIGRTEQPKEGL